MSQDPERSDELAPPEVTSASVPRVVTRGDLYRLVWERPLVKVAKAFGLSDVGLRKICAKHDIPTPRLGCWAKLAHGKRVKRPPLPPSRNPGSDRAILTARLLAATSPAIEAEQMQALGHDATFPRIVVPTTIPPDLHRVAAATRRALREAKADEDRIKQTATASAVSTAVSVGSADRAVRIIHSLAVAAEARGFEFGESQGGIKLRLRRALFEWRLYEIKDRRAHEPTRQELKTQATYDEQRARYPSLYRARQTYRSWDLVPSGRLGMSLADATIGRWSRDRFLGHWRDRKTSGLEDYLDDSLSAMTAAEVAIRHRLEAEAEQERKRQAEITRQHEEHLKAQRAVKRQEYLVRKAKEFSQLQEPELFAEHVRFKLQGSDCEWVTALG